LSKNQVNTSVIELHKAELRILQMKNLINTSMLQIKTKGKIIIQIEKDGDQINSNMELKGIAKQEQVTLTTLLINFASFSLKSNKDPEKLIKMHLDSILQMIREKKTEQ